jgi:hypothetical protein
MSQTMQKNKPKIVTDKKSKNHQEEEISNQEPQEEQAKGIIYKLPDSAEKMQKLIATIKENPGDIDITI